jgi:anti-sigma B factor antagonist
MKLDFKKTEKYLLVKVSGRLDISNTTHFKAEISNYLKDTRFVIFDFSELEFMDSTGLGSIISVLKVISKNNGNIFIASLREKPRILFEITRAKRIFDIYPTVEDAINAVENYKEEE